MEVITRLEEIVLLSIWKLKDDAYGVPINKEVSRNSKKEYSMGALYFTLDQLVRKGLVLKNTGEPTPERGGRSKVYYSLTTKGEQALQTARELHNQLWQNIPEMVFNRKN